MSARQFAEFRKEMDGQFPGSPSVIFEQNTVTITSQGFPEDKLVLVVLALPFPLSLVDWPWLIFALLLLPVWLIYFHSHFIAVGTLEIDFLTETVRIRNRYDFLNWKRQVFKVKSEFAFSEIIEIGHKHSPFIDRLGRGIRNRSLLFFETDSDWEIFASQFREEEDAENLVLALRKFVLPEKKL